MFSKVIVFGPTGNIGSIVARTACEKGAKVILAMRDVTKPIPSLDVVRGTRGEFERITVDLHRPHEVGAAIRQSEATAAFVYVAHGSHDHMEASLEAAKAAGIQFLVLLSSFTITKKPEDVEKHDRIPYVHARVEMTVERLWGSSNYVALRAGAFATNTLRWAAGLKSGEIRLDNPKRRYDFITPEDMGTVGGRILVRGQCEGQKIVYLYGPHLLTQENALDMATATLGKSVMKADPLEREDTTPQRAADSFVLVRPGIEELTGNWFQHAYENHAEGADNVFKFTGNPAMTYDEWVRANVKRFSV